jgi:catechol 2,3-dioxygenase-like lactoylglutathione lyase family enzyme
MLSHVDLVVSSIDRSLPFYRGLLEPLGWTDLREVTGERGEKIWYLSSPEEEGGSLGLREKLAGVHPVPNDRHAAGLHHVCFRVGSREVVDERSEWLADQGVKIESGAREYAYRPGHYALFFYDPDGIKLELLHRPPD